MACPSSDKDQWPGYFHHQPTNLQSSITNVNCYDSTMLTTNSVITTSSCNMEMSPSQSDSPGNMAAASSGESAKPIRRRSRASKKTPATLLNADVNNFRDLVQQFTGKPSPPSVVSQGVQRGPVNIDFGQGSSSADDQGLISGSRYMPFGASYDDHGYGAVSQQQLQYDHQGQSYGRVMNNPTSDVEISGNFAGDDLNIDDLDWSTVTSSTYGNENNHFM